jgi:MFS family permease
VTRRPLPSNYWKLWVASVTSNLGDGVSSVAYPWLASAITRNGFKLGLVVLATRLPWLVFSLPAGVITDRVDRKRLMVVMDVARFALTVGVALVVLANASDLANPTSAALVDRENLLLALLALAAFLLGMAEVLRDNSAQTILPAIVERDDLERANGRMWGAEMVMNSFVGPPVGGFLLAASLALPFFVDAGSFAIAAGLVFLVAGQFRARPSNTEAESMRTQIKEGFGWLWRHPFFRPLALVLGVQNGLMMMTMATYVLFVQEILGLQATAYGVLLTAGAFGGVAGSLLASRLVARIGKGTALFGTILTGVVAFALTGLTSSAPLVWALFVTMSFAGTVWNVVTVSLRQRVIPDELLGRVNSVYRFFGWGMMSIGALLGGALVSLAQPLTGREWALRLPFLVAAAAQLAAYVYSLPRLNSARIAATEAEVADAVD